MISIAVLTPMEYYQKEFLPLLQNYCEHYCRYEIQLNYYSSVENLRTALKEGDPFDIYLIDLEMEQQAGVGLMKELRSVGAPVSLMGIASDKQLSYEALQLSVSGYFIRPVKKNLLYQKLDQILGTMKKKEKIWYEIDGMAGKEKVLLSDIIYIEKYERSLRFHLEENRIVETKKLRESFDNKVEILLQNPYFIRVHSSFVVNTMKVVKLEKDSLLLKDGIRVPVSARRYREVKTSFQKVHSRTAVRNTHISQALQFNNLHPDLQVFDQLPVAVCVIRVDVNSEGKPYDFVFMYVNDAMCTLERVPKGKLIGASFYEIFEKIEEVRLLEYWKTAYFGENRKFVTYSFEAEATLHIATWQPWHGYCGCLMDGIELPEHA